MTLAVHGYDVGRIKKICDRMQDRVQNAVLRLKALWTSVRKFPGRLCKNLLDRCVSCQMYHREYPQRFWAVLFAIILFLVLAVWLVVEIYRLVCNDESTTADLANPLSLVLA